MRKGKATKIDIDDAADIQTDNDDSIKQRRTEIKDHQKTVIPMYSRCD
jgi:hypothetical protein